MNEIGLAEHVLGTSDWSEFKAANGNGEPVRIATAALLAAESGEAARAAYWRIENHAVVQGELFDVSEVCASALVAALADPRPYWVRIALLELLFQFLAGHPKDMRQRCERAVREGLWLLRREALLGEREAALDVLEQLGEAGEREA